jgi:serine/threonine protein kinase
MSPERLAGEGYGAPGDIWSLGILLLEMATRFVQYTVILLVSYISYMLMLIAYMVLVLDMY